MTGRYQPSAGLSIKQLQTLQSKFRIKVAAVVVLLGIAVAGITFAESGVRRAYYGGLGTLFAGFMFAQYRKERALVQDHQTAVGVVTEYRVRWRRTPHLWNGAPRIKYSFVAFDMKTYMDESGWGVAGLREGTQITILYRTSNPASSLPLRSFVFYSFPRSLTG